MVKMKKVIMQIIKIILVIICLILASLVVHFMDYPKASPFPAIIGVSMMVVIDIIISHILIKTKHENSPFFDPEHQWKYGFPMDIVILLIVILVYLYQLDMLRIS